LLLTLRGTPTIYMGDELGMVDTPIPEAEVRDPAELREPGHGLGRDPERTPFPWQNGPGAGFTTATPWLRIGADTPLSRQRDDPTSMVTLHRRLLALRRDHPALAGGAIENIAAHGTVLSFQRSGDDGRFAMLANISHEQALVDAPQGKLLLSTHPTHLEEHGARTLVLRADEAIVVQLV
jgi:alpha-glucosidase